MEEKNKLVLIIVRKTKNHYTLTILTPLIETPNPPCLTPRKGPQNKWQLDTPADIPRILRACPIKLFGVFTLPEANRQLAPENQSLEDDPFLLGRPIFGCVCS